MPVLIVAEPGRWRDSLQVLLRAVNGIKLLSPTESAISALPSIAATSPILVMLDFNLPDNQAWTLLRRIKSDYPQARCLALIESEVQKPLVLAAGADGVLLAGFTLEMLQTALEQIAEPYETDSSQELSDEALDRVAGGQENPTFTINSTITNIFNPGERW